MNVETTPTIVGKLETQVTYPICDAELDFLIKLGTQSDLHLNVAVAAISFALSTTVVLITINDLSPIQLAGTWCIMGVGYSCGAYALFIYGRLKSNVVNVVHKIKARTNVDLAEDNPNSKT